jgi:hypothetical protein
MTTDRIEIELLPFDFKLSTVDLFSPTLLPPKGVSIAHSPSHNP